MEDAVNPTHLATKLHPLAIPTKWVQCAHPIQRLTVGLFAEEVSQLFHTEFSNTL